MEEILRHMNIPGEVIAIAISRYPAGGSHGLSHAVRVCHNANFLSEGFDIDRTAMLSAALLHDVGRLQEGPHAGNGANLVRECLGKININLDVVCNIIQIHNDRIRINSPEAEFVWDADKLDILGMNGIVRICQRSGELNGLGLTKDKNSAFSEIRRKIDSLQPERFFTKPGQHAAVVKWRTMVTALEMMEREIDR